MDKTRDAEIYDMAIVRRGVCAKHPIHERNLRCCISYTGPHPTFETCALREQGYMSREHMCCYDDWTVVGQPFNEIAGGGTGQYNASC